MLEVEVTGFNRVRFGGIIAAALVFTFTARGFALAEDPAKDGPVSGGYGARNHELEEEEAKVLRDLAALQRIPLDDDPDAEKPKAPGRTGKSGTAARKDEPANIRVTALDETLPERVVPVKAAPAVEEESIPAIKEEEAGEVLEEMAPPKAAPKKNSTSTAKKAAKTEKKPSPEKAKAELIASLQKANMDLVNELRGKESRLEELKRELDESRNRLILAETEVQRLSQRVAAKNRESLNSFMGGPGGAALPAHIVEPAPAPRARLAPQPAAAAAADSDVPLVQVIKDKVALRTGPGPEHSQLMAVSRGTRLTVETRNGNWYRVNTPSGSRAWVSGDVVQFLTPGAGPGSTVKVKGFEHAEENKDLKLRTYEKGEQNTALPHVAGDNRSEEEKAYELLKERIRVEK